MKPLLLIAAYFSFSILVAQTPIDELQKQNIQYLESQENEGYAFRSQIITEFDAAHASQNVNIKLSQEYTYIVVALGDSNIPGINLDIKPVSKAKMETMPLDDNLAGAAHLVTPSKSGRFKITINAAGLEGSKTGFISFMVLRKD